MGALRFLFQLPCCGPDELGAFTQELHCFAGRHLRPVSPPDDYDHTACRQDAVWALDSVTGKHPPGQKYGTGALLIREGWREAAKNGSGSCPSYICAVEVHADQAGVERLEWVHDTSLERALRPACRYMAVYAVGNHRSEKYAWMEVREAVQAYLGYARDELGWKPAGRRRGRPQREPDQTARIADAWETGGHTTYQQAAVALGGGLTAEDVRLAVDRSRNVEARRKRSSEPN